MAIRFSFKPLLRKDRLVKENGTFPINYLVRIGGKQIKISSKKEIHEIYCDKKFGKYDDEVRIIFHYKCFSQANVLLNTWSVAFVFINKQKNESMQPPVWFMEGFMKRFNKL